jgi:DnaK suppressor protein
MPSPKGMTSHRDVELRRILEERRDEIAGEVRTKVRGARAHQRSDQGVDGRSPDTLDASDSGVQDDIEFALIQMKAETLIKIGVALTRLENGDYGYCYECGSELPVSRLNALPFAVRCRLCQEVWDVAQERKRRLAQSKGGDILGLW